MDQRSKRAPCVDLRTDHVKDERFAVLGDIAGYNRYEAVGRMVGLWSWCVDRKLKDAPDDSDGYVVDTAVAKRFLGADAVRALLADDCDAFALGVLRPDGRIYLRGTSEYVAQLRRLVAIAHVGGKARAADSHRNGGRFVSNNTIDQPTTSQAPAIGPAGDQRATSGNQRSSSSSSSSSSSEEKKKARPAADAPPAIHKPAVEAFDGYYRSTHNDAKPTWNAKTIAMVKTLCSKHGTDEVVRRIGVLRDSPPQWPIGPWDLATFVQHFDKCAGGAPNGTTRFIPRLA